MVYEIKVTQTVSGTIYVEGENYEDAEKNARQFIKKDPKHVASIIFNETWVTEVGSQEAPDKASNGIALLHKTAHRARQNDAEGDNTSAVVPAKVALGRQTWGRTLP